MEQNSLPTFNFRQPAISGLAYGAGLLVGNVLSLILMRAMPSSLFLYGSPTLRLLLGVLLAFFFTGMGGLLGGLIGGYSLPPIGWGKSKGRRGHSWRSGITFGVGYGLLVFPLLLIVSLLSFYDISNLPVYVFSLTFGVVGLLFGAMMGLSLGLWTVGRRFAPIFWLSMAGFGAGGLFLGYGLWRFIFAITAGVVEDGPFSWLLFGLFFFGGLGGAALGYIYDRAATQAEEALNPVRHLTLRDWQKRWLIVGVVLLLLALLLRPVVKAVGDLLTPVESGLASELDLRTIGTHWLEATAVTPLSPSASFTLAAGPGGALALAWTDDDGFWLQSGQWQPATRQTAWQAPLLVQTGAAAEPALVVGENGRFHLAWAENNTIRYSQCLEGSCTPPTTITPAPNCAQPAAPGNDQPTLALNEGRLLLVWRNAADILPYAAWPADAAPPAQALGCAPGAAANPTLDAAFHLSFVSTSGEIGLTQFDGVGWAAVNGVGNGRFPAIAPDPTGQAHLAWCADDGLYYSLNGQTEFVARFCQGRPQIVLNSQGQAHLLWLSPQLQDSNGQMRPQAALVESVRQESGWTPPAIVSHALAANPVMAARPALVATADGSLHLAWAGADGLQIAAQTPYACQTTDLSPYGEILYDVTAYGGFWQPGSLIPFCGNRYDRLIYTPNPKPAYNDPHLPTPNGGFDVFADLIREARYEVLFATMWYAQAHNHDSPGSVVAEAIADLYRQLQANPAQYPRGLTVRLILGNPPELALGQTTGQLWTLIDDLRHAGIDKMVDEEIGWRLEVADYAGNLPHSHVKTLIVDGRTSVAVGYNMTYDHFPADHPSGRGVGRFDIGIQVTGPVAQASQRAFDDLWQGSDQRVCLDLNPPLGAPWQLTCFDRSGVSDHVPEVQKFFLTDDDSHAFSVYRSRALPLGDLQTADVIAAAQTRVDATHVMFSLDMICSLNFLFDVCNYEHGPYYIPALLQAVENGARLRLLVHGAPFEGIENNVALNVFLARAAELGRADQIEVRYFAGPFHPKAVLVDDQMLIVGSQNFHYSAYGAGRGLTEYSIAVEDTRAAAEFRQSFEVEWAAATPRQR